MSSLPSSVSNPALVEEGRGEREAPAHECRPGAERESSGAPAGYLAPAARCQAGSHTADNLLLVRVITRLWSLMWK
jgi:hypothetical protein